MNIRLYMLFSTRFNSRFHKNKSTRKTVLFSCQGLPCLDFQIICSDTLICWLCSYNTQLSVCNQSMNHITQLSTCNVSTNPSIQPSPCLCTCARKSFWLLMAWWNLFTNRAWNCFRIRVAPFTCLEPFPALLSDAPWVMPLDCIPLCSVIDKRTYSKSIHKTSTQDKAFAEEAEAYSTKHGTCTHL